MGAREHFLVNITAFRNPGGQKVMKYHLSLHTSGHFSAISLCFPPKPLHTSLLGPFVFKQTFFTQIHTEPQHLQIPVPVLLGQA